MNNGVSLLRAATSAVVQRPTNYKRIFDSARREIKGSTRASAALLRLEQVFEKHQPASRTDLEKIGKSLLPVESMKKIGPTLSTDELAGRSLLSALDEIPSRR